MRVLVLAPHPFFSFRGTPIAVRSVLEALAGAGHELTVLTYHEGEDIRLAGCEIRRIPRIPGVRGIRPGFSLKKVISDVALFGLAARTLRRDRFDLVHAVEEAVFVAMALELLHGVPFVYDMDSSLVRQMVDRFAVLRPFEGLLEACERAAVRQSVGVLAVCRSLAERAAEQAPGQLVQTLEDFSLLDRAGEPGETLTPRGAGAAPIVMYVGNLEPYQGVDLLLDAFALARAQVPSARLVVIGGSSGAVARYRASARALGLAGHARFLGPRPLGQLRWYLQQAQVLVSPRNRGDNTAMKIYSYLDSGRPIVATRLPTHTQVLTDDTACLVEPEPEAMCRGIVALLEDETLRHRLARRARQRVRVEFGREAFRAKLLAFYGAVERKLGLGRPAPQAGAASAAGATAEIGRPNPATRP